MKIIKVVPRDIYAVCELSLIKAKQLKAVLNKAVISPTTPDEIAGADYLENELEPMLDSFIEEFGDAT